MDKPRVNNKTMDWEVVFQVYDDLRDARARIAELEERIAVVKKDSLEYAGQVNTKYNALREAVRHVVEELKEERMPDDITGPEAFLIRAYDSETAELIPCDAIDGLYEVHRVGDCGECDKGTKYTSTPGGTVSSPCPTCHGDGGRYELRLVDNTNDREVDKGLTNE